MRKQWAGHEYSDAVSPTWARKQKKNVRGERRDAGPDGRNRSSRNNQVKLSMENERKTDRRARADGLFLVLPDGLAIY